MASSHVDLSYDRDENIVYMSFPVPVELRTREDIAAHFQSIIDFWRVSTVGQRCYFVVDIDNVTINAGEIDFYAQETKRAHDICAIASVRYGGNHLQRTVTRLAGMKLQQPSNIYATRGQAIAALRAMRGQTGLASESPKPKRALAR
jgi:hypothetical protein